MRKDENIPNDLAEDGEGQRLWKWLHDACEGIAESEPLVVEICRIAERLEQVRSKIKVQGLSFCGNKRNPLLDSELKLSAQFNRLWKQLGLSDKEEDSPRRPVGRPPAGDKLWPD